MPDRSENEGLTRTLNLPAALAIGIGTMLGAGVFVFPGLAANEAGPAAMLSFAIAGGVALLVAACTAELSTAMPSSGGAYFHVSRTFGDLGGWLVGIAQSAGLVFASAFYLVAFADYVFSLPLGFEDNGGLTGAAIAAGAALLLALVNIVGSKAAGRLQLGVVVVLVILLAGVFGAGLLRAGGATGDSMPLADFAPFGAMPVLTTAAFVFTSYLGFVQIATVAGEVRNPDRTLPAALIGSVSIVTLLYVVALFVTTALLPPERLAETGSEAIISVGEFLFGDVGKTVILVAGLLATLSSANASILSSSRTLYALGRDRLAPLWSVRISTRFGTPYISIVLVGVAVAGLAFLGNLKLLAEVASVLHLVIYGLICAALLRKRGQGEADYRPPFKLPYARFIAALGIASCAGLIVFMEPMALLTSAGILIGASAWYAMRAGAASAASSSGATPGGD